MPLDDNVLYNHYLKLFDHSIITRRKFVIQIFLVRSKRSLSMTLTYFSSALVVGSFENNNTRSNIQCNTIVHCDLYSHINIILYITFDAYGGAQYLLLIITFRSDYY